MKLVRYAFFSYILTVRIFETRANLSPAAHIGFDIHLYCAYALRVLIILDLKLASFIDF